MNKHVYINGKWESGSGEPLKVICPAKGVVVWEGQAADRNQTTRAVDGALNAFDSWRLMPLQGRIEILERYATGLERKKEQIAKAISSEMGKQLWEAESEVDAMIGKIAISIKAYDERSGLRSETTSFGTSQLSHKPHGVFAVFGPFNFPGHLPNGHIVPALLAGNTCVFKPSEQAPTVAQLIVEATQYAGLPEGCLQVVNGGRLTGEALLRTDINGVLFTGSPQVGCYFHMFFAGRPEIMLALEMGGNNPLIVWEPADIDVAADIVINSTYLTTGQRCSSARRIILPNDEYGRNVTESIEAKANDIKSGAWDEGRNDMGPLVSERVANEALEFQEIRCKQGAKAIKALERLERGNGFVSLGVVDSTEAEEHDEELFAPFIQIYRVDNFDEAIHVANNTRFGLSGGFISDNDLLWARVQNDLKCGILNRNRSIVGASSNMPFGGPGISGNFRPGAYYAADYCAWPQSSQITDRTDSV